jgi:tetratricopeptide (TPR) repeat protein
MYAIAGIVTVCILIGTFRRSGIPGFFLAASVLFMLPALIIATTSFAWTPFGERYLYIPSAFAVIGCLDLFYRFLVRRNAIKLFMPIVSILIVIASITTFQRGVLWGDNRALIEDTIMKSPDFGVIRNQYGCLLKQEGRLGEAEQQFTIALQQNNKNSVNRIIRLNLLWIKIDGKPLEDARRILLAEIGSKADGDVELLKQIKVIDENMLGKAVAFKDRAEIVADIIETNEYLFIRTGDPHYIYRSGQLALSLGNKQKAGQFFRKAYENPRLNDYYREPARKLAEKLVTE